MSSARHVHREIYQLTIWIHSMNFIQLLIMPTIHGTEHVCLWKEYNMCLRLQPFQALDGSCTSPNILRLIASMTYDNTPLCANMHI